MALTDRQRVELALPARIMFDVAAQCAEPGDAAGQSIVDGLAAACREPLDGLHGSAAGKLARRVERASTALLAPFRDKATAGKVAMTGYYFVEALIADGALELYEGSPMADATGKMLGYLDASFGIADLDKSAQKAGRKMVDAARGLGLYGTA